MQTIISLEGLEFYAYHGHYEEEKKLGSRFMVDVYIQLPTTKACTTDQLSDTVDYEKAYQLIKELMIHPVHLMETLAQKIMDRLFSMNAAIKGIQVAIAKIDPPIGGICHKAKVVLTSPEFIY